MPRKSFRVDEPEKVLQDLQGFIDIKAGREGYTSGLYGEVFRFAYNHLMVDALEQGLRFLSYFPLNFAGDKEVFHSLSKRGAACVVRVRRGSTRRHKSYMVDLIA